MANSSSRGGARVIWVCVHTAEGIRKASDLKAFFDRSTNSSSHAVADDFTLLDNLVPYDRASWTLRNGNSRSLNLELCGFASWSRDEWIRNHQGMLNNAAAWIRRACDWARVPIVKLSPADVRAGKAGVIGHVDYTKGTGDGTHWDPGPGFPWDIVIARTTGSAGGSTPTEEDEMELDDVFTTRFNNPLRIRDFFAWTDFRITEIHNMLNGAVPSKVDPNAKLKPLDFLPFVDYYATQANRKADALLDLISKQNNVSARDIADALHSALAADLLPVLKNVLEEALEDDNGEQADAIVDAFLAKLAKLTPQEG